MLEEIEVYFPYDGTYLDASVQDWTRRWLFTCAWQHTKISQAILVADLPADEDTLKQMAIDCYERHKWRNLLRDMDPEPYRV